MVTSFLNRWLKIALKFAADPINLHLDFNVRFYMPFVNP